MVHRMRNKKKKEVSIFMDRLRLNYDNAWDFVKRSGVPVATETVRRLLYEGEKVNTTSLVIVLKYIGFTTEEIRDVLLHPENYIHPDAKEARYAQDFIDLMGYGQADVTDQDKIIMAAFRSLRNKSEEAYALALAQVALTCKSVSADCGGLTSLIRPQTPI